MLIKSWKGQPPAVLSRSTLHRGTQGWGLFKTVAPAFFVPVLQGLSCV